MAYKVGVWGTGNVGRPAIRAVLSHSELELVGVIVASGDHYHAAEADDRIRSQSGREAGNHDHGGGLWRS